MTGRPANSFTAALLACCLALGIAFGFAKLLRRRAAAVSHELPVAGRSIPPPNVPRPVLVSRGRTLFLNSCAHCHGADARGDEGPDLHDLQVSDRRVVTVITRGIKGEMPSFAKKHDAGEIAALLAYVRSLDTTAMD